LLLLKKHEEEGDPLYVRISRGAFDADVYEEVKARLDSSQESLIPAIKELPGVLDYYAGIDASSGTMVNVSVWDTGEHAQAMASLPEMLALRESFDPLGVRFEPIVNYEVLWRV
jgi:quinol monooxygenase YgiN